MKNVCRAFGTLIVAALLLVGPVRATSFTTDQSDIWNAVNEPGWAVEFVNRGTAIFAVLYVYDQTKTPIWYSATLEFAGNGTWSGDLYQTSGPWFGTVPFNSAAVTLRKVGTMTWVAQSTISGVLAYTVDGVPVTKNIVRYLVRYDDFSGHFFGGVHETAAGCASPGLNGTTETPSFVYIGQNGQAVSIQTVELESSASCTYNGTLSQAGQMGSVTGNFTCSTGATGAFTFFEMQINPQGITGRLALNYSVPQGCTSTGWFGGIRGSTF